MFSPAGQILCVDLTPHGSSVWVNPFQVYDIRKFEIESPDELIEKAKKLGVREPIISTGHKKTPAASVLPPPRVIVPTIRQSPESEMYPTLFNET